ncbi:hypothetical protein [Sandaracinus amylolyticus]|uniref:Uncharacterized protein n=1 Tax=Sandaracinus amylolyticus TaxID=927083 RepID=A0A0F6SFR5_9BACT|nr:hypothetical protein [Sandaracinus amylolyticus]AKF07404.1 hypothetical protein DB32_004553 [Sandaracinus amylolyticus]
MSDRSRYHLPTFGAVHVPTRAPTVDEARASLGGRASTSPEAGALVQVIEASSRVSGVIVFASAEERDVWIGEGRLRRVARSSCVDAEGPMDPALAPVAADASRFAALSEGTRVRYHDRRGVAHEGTLVEKCRYGALVESSAGRVLAVSFRRIERA